ncbi:MAG TPA: hypothetical protein VFR05_01940 [Terriglobia bacterium]|nr:hypothetical protein [Terriglobia bacterium]
MQERIIPETIQSFILEKIDSVAELEGLLILRTNPAEKWTSHKLAERLYVDEQRTAELLTNLCTKGLVTVQGDEKVREYSYLPESPDLAAMVDELAYFYSKHIVPVTNLIHFRATHRVQQFADAFKLRKDD